MSKLGWSRDLRKYLRFDSIYVTGAPSKHLITSPKIISRPANLHTIVKSSTSLNQLTRKEYPIINIIMSSNGGNAGADAANSLKKGLTGVHVSELHSNADNTSFRLTILPGSWRSHPRYPFNPHGT